MSYLDTVRVGEHRPKSPLEDLLPNLGDVKDKDGGGGGDTQEIKSSLPDASSDLQLSTDSNLRFSEGFFSFSETVEAFTSSISSSSLVGAGSPLSELT